MHLQHNKVDNLAARRRADRRPAHPARARRSRSTGSSATARAARATSTACGSPTARPMPGVGGGICQLANLVHWMVLHSQLTVVERSEHSFDPFPDKGRVLPWGVGCSIVYNYVDLVVRNDTDHTFQLRDLGRRALPARPAARRRAARALVPGRGARRAVRAARRTGLPAQRDLAQRASTGAPATRSARSWSSATARWWSTSPGPDVEVIDSADAAPRSTTRRGAEHRQVLERVGVVDDEVRRGALVERRRPRATRGPARRRPRARRGRHADPHEASISPAMLPWRLVPPPSEPA